MFHRPTARLTGAVILGAGLALSSAAPAFAQDDTITTTEGDTFPVAVCTSDGPADELDGADDAPETDGTDQPETDGSDSKETDDGTDGTEAGVDFPELDASDPDDDGRTDPEGSPDQTDGTADEKDGYLDYPDRRGDPDGDGPDEADEGNGGGRLDYPEHNAEDSPVAADDDDNREGALDKKDGRVDYPEHKTSGQPDDDGTTDPEGAPDLTDGAADEKDGADDQLDGPADQVETDGTDTLDNEDCQTEQPEPGAGEDDSKDGTDGQAGGGDQDGTEGKDDTEGTTPPADEADKPAGGGEQASNVGVISDDGQWTWDGDEWQPVAHEDTDGGAAPEGGVETGDGGLADTGVDALGWLAAGLGLAGAGAFAIAGGPRLLRGGARR